MEDSSRIVYSGHDDDDDMSGDLHKDIATARQNLLKWRADGNAEKIEFWKEKLDELIDKLPRKAAK